jgi:carbamoyltransferase
MRYILGINAFHGDSSACIFCDGEMLAAVEEERFTRVKHWAGFPEKSIQYCLSYAGISLKDISDIAINQDPFVNIHRKVIYSLLKRPNFNFLVSQFIEKKKRQSIRDYFLNFSPDQELKAKFHKVEHHRAHLSSAFHVSPFSEAAILSIDGFGDFTSTAWGFGSGVDISVDEKVYFPHSLGIFYQAITQFIGFYGYGDEYKVMGLAPYGSNSLINKMRSMLFLKSDGKFELNLEYFNHHTGGVGYGVKDGSPFVGVLFKERIQELLGPMRATGDLINQRHKDIAYAAQFIYEEAFFHILNFMHNKYKCDSIAIAGGCGMNSVANGKISLATKFKNVYIQSASGDAGGAIGAALTVWHNSRDLNSQSKISAHAHAYWGPEYDDEKIKSTIDENISKLSAKQFILSEDQSFSELILSVAKNIADGDVVGWFQDRLEWGPRALGNRSILCDPRRSDVKDVLNIKIKRRESFRPFAPSILEEYVDDWFEQSEPVPFMSQVFQIKKNKQQLIPGVTHIDGSGRLQTVSKVSNPKYHALISAFKSITGIPILLNTSFNENEPIVCSPQEALDCFLRTRMDVLVMGKWVIRRVN